MSHRIALVVPARLASQRLPKKVLLPWLGQPLIHHVLKRVADAQLGDVFLACDHEDIADAATTLPVQCLLTDPDVPSGTDRVYWALKKADLLKNYDMVVNIQGDLPNVSATMINAAITSTRLADIGTVACSFTSQAKATSPAVVKIARDAQGFGLYFSRAPIPHNADTFLHHVGIYGFQTAALEGFVSLAPSALEKSENLEQLRALEAGMRIHVTVVDEAPPLSIDTQEDYDALLALAA